MDKRGWIIVCLALISLSLLNPDYISSAQSTAELEGQIAYIGTDDHIWIARNNLADRIRITSYTQKDLGRFRNPKFSPDGRYLAFCQTHNKDTDYHEAMYLVNTIDLQIFELDHSASCSFDWSPDSQKLIFSPIVMMGMVPEETDIWMLDIYSREKKYLTSSYESNPIAPQWSPDGTQISFFDFCFECVGQFKTIKVGTGEQFEWSEYNSDWYIGADVSWSPDGKYLAFDKVLPVYVGPEDTYGLHLSSADGKDRWEIYNSPQKSAAYPLWSTGGQNIAFNQITVVVEDMTAVHYSELLLIAPDGSNTRSAYSGRGEIIPQAWSPSGRHLIFSHQIDWGENEMLMVLDTQTMTVANFDEGPSYAGVAWGSIPKITTMKSQAVENISPDAQGIIFVSEDAKLMFFNPKIGESIPLSTPNSGVEIWISPDGNHILQGGNLISFSSAADGSITVTQKQTTIAPFSGKVGWRPDGTQLAYMDHHNQIWLYNLENENHSQLPPGYDLPKWSYDGKWIAYCDTNRDLWVSLSNQELEQIAQYTSCDFEWSPNKALLAYTHGVGYEPPTHKAMIYNPEDGQINDLQLNGKAEAWSSDGNLLSVERIDVMGASANNYTMFAVDPQTGKALQLGSYHDWDLGTKEWIPQEVDYLYGALSFTNDLISSQVVAENLLDVSFDGKKTLFGQGDLHDFKIICHDSDLNQQNLLLTVDAYDSPGYWMPGLWGWFSHDGAWIAINDYQEYGTQSWLANCDGSKITALPGEFRFKDRFFSPDNNWFVIHNKYNEDGKENLIYIRNLQTDALITHPIANGSEAFWYQMPPEPPTFTIEGKIQDINGAALAGISVTLSNNQVVYTDDNGFFLFNDISPGTYTITPSLEGYDFMPKNQQVVVNSENLKINLQGVSPKPPVAEKSASSGNLLVFFGKGILILCVIFLFVFLGIVFVVYYRRKRSKRNQSKDLNLPKSDTSSPIGSGNFQTHLQEGIHLIQTNELDLGIKKLHHVIKVSNENTDAWFWLGIAAVKQKQMRTAERCFFQAKNYGHPNAEAALQWLHNQVSPGVNKDDS